LHTFSVLLMLFKFHFSQNFKLPVWANRGKQAK
jgi:hypothetical protein